MNPEYYNVDHFMETFPDQDFSLKEKQIMDEFFSLLQLDPDTLCAGHAKADIQYEFGCRCQRDQNDDCTCPDNIVYYDDAFMRNKIPMYPESGSHQAYYDSVFPQRKYQTKIFYYLPNGSKSVCISNADANARNLQRNTRFKMIDGHVVLIEDEIYGAFCGVVKHVYTPVHNPLAFVALEKKRKDFADSGGSDSEHYFEQTFSFPRESDL